MCFKRFRIIVSTGNNPSITMPFENKVFIVLEFQTNHFKTF